MERQNESKAKTPYYPLECIILTAISSIGLEEQINKHIQEKRIPLSILSLAKYSTAPHKIDEYSTNNKHSYTNQVLVYSVLLFYPKKGSLTQQKIKN